MLWKAGALVLIALACVLAVAPTAARACDQLPEPDRWLDAGRPDPPPQRGVFAVHRGGGTIAPEETIGAFSASIGYGADWVEGDVRESKDGRYVLMHDETIDRLTNPARVTELGEALAFAGASGVGMDLDVKAVSSVAHLVRYASRYEAFDETFFEVDPHEVAAMRAARPGVNVMFNLPGGGGAPAEPPGTLYALTQPPFGYELFGSRLDKFTPEKVAEIHDGCGMALPHSYDRGDANEAAEIEAGLARGIDGFQVNAPDVAAAALGPPVPTRIRFASSRTVCLENAENGNGLPYERLSAGGSRTVLTLRFGCARLPAGTGRGTTVSFAGDASALPSSARRAGSSR